MIIAIQEAPPSVLARAVIATMAKHVPAQHDEHMLVMLPVVDGKRVYPDTKRIALHCQGSVLDLGSGPDYFSAFDTFKQISNRTRIPFMLVVISDHLYRQHIHDQENHAHAFFQRFIGVH